MKRLTRRIIIVWMAIAPILFTTWHECVYVPRRWPTLAEDGVDPAGLFMMYWIGVFVAAAIATMVYWAVIAWRAE